MKFRLLTSYNDYITANLRMQQLESEGIRCVLQDEHSVTINPIFSNAVGGIKLLVYEEQWDRAVEIMTRLEEEYRNAARCPRCGTPGLQLGPVSPQHANWLTRLFSWLFGNYGDPESLVYHCSHCGYEMKELPSPEQSGSYSK